MELVPGADSWTDAVLPELRDLRADRRCHRLSRHHAAHGRTYDVFGNGKTALKANLGSYSEERVSVTWPPTRIQWREFLRAVLGAGFANPGVGRNWTDSNGNFTPDCDLMNPAAQNLTTTGGDICGAWNNQLFGSTQQVGAVYDPNYLEGWGVRPSDWSLGLSVQQQVFPRASVEVGYYRRTFTGFSVTDNLLTTAASYDTFVSDGALRSAFARRRWTSNLEPLQPQIPVLRPDQQLHHGLAELLRSPVSLVQRC